MTNIDLISKDLPEPVKKTIKPETKKDTSSTLKPISALPDSIPSPTLNQDK